MNDEERLRRGSSYGPVAAAYAEHRPDYPEDSVRWCLAAAGQDVSRLRVLDLGAGTGKLTALLARLCADVTAVEPDPVMLTELRLQLPGVRSLPGSAEAIPLPEDSVDAVLCGQSLHWFDLDVAVPEIARVLAVGGVLGALWNCYDDRVEWVAGLKSVAQGAANPSLSDRRADEARFGADRFGPGRFSPADRAEFPHGQARTAGSLVATIATHSKMLVIEQAERDQLLADVTAYLAGRPETSSGEFTVPMVTTALRAVRRGTGVSPRPTGL